MNALAMYGERLNNRELYNMAVQMDSTSTPGWSPYVYLHQETFNDYQTFYVNIIIGGCYILFVLVLCDGIMIWLMIW